MLRPFSCPFMIHDVIPATTSTNVSCFDIVRNKDSNPKNAFPKVLDDLEKLW